MLIDMTHTITPEIPIYPGAPVCQNRPQYPSSMAPVLLTLGWAGSLSDMSGKLWVSRKGYCSSYPKERI